MGDSGVPLRLQLTSRLLSRCKKVYRLGDITSFWEIGIGTIMEERLRYTICMLIGNTINAKAIFKTNHCMYTSSYVKYEPYYE